MATTAWVIGGIAGAVVVYMIARSERSRSQRELMSDAEVAAIIERFVNGGGRGREWAEFAEVPFHNAHLEGTRRRCAEIWDGDSLVGADRLNALRAVAAELRTPAANHAISKSPNQ